MNRFESVTDGTASHSTWLPNDGNQVAGYKPLRWLMALLLVAFVAGCGNGGGGRDPILGGAGNPILNLVSIKVTPPSPSIALGTTQQFTATGFYANGPTKDLTSFVTWTITPLVPAVTVIATINSGGLATSCGVSTTCIAGTTTIKATLGTISGTAVLNVTNASLISIQVTPLPSLVPTVAVGSTLQFIATGKFSDTTTQDLTSSVTWADLPLAASAVASISSLAPTNGLATGLVPGGPDTITATDPITTISSAASGGNSTLTVIAGPGPAGPAPTLGAAAPFGGFGGGAGMTNQGILTSITGDQGQPVSIGTTGASTTMTGFHDNSVTYNPPAGGCIYTETSLNVGAVSGTINTAPPPPTTTALPCPNEGTAATFKIAQDAALAALNAYDNLAARTGATIIPSQLSGQILAPGVYASADGTFLLTGGDLTLDGGAATGLSNGVWVFQMATTLTVGDAAVSRSVILAGGAQPKNVFWQVGSAATINPFANGGTMVGTIISKASTTFSTPGNLTITTLDGRALALTASTTLVNTVINVPAP